MAMLQIDPGYTVQASAEGTRRVRRSAMRRTPQEKKRLSYARDRRNNYGENDKSSRKNIPRSRAMMHRANRHRTHQVLGDAKGAPDAAVEDGVEQRLLNRRPKKWRKWRDSPLSEIVEYKLQRRVRLGIDAPERAEKRIWRVRQQRR
jgi:hypothetical protein